MPWVGVVARRAYTALRRGPARWQYLPLTKLSAISRLYCEESYPLLAAFSKVTKSPSNRNHSRICCASSIRSILYGMDAPRLPIIKAGILLIGTMSTSRSFRVGTPLAQAYTEPKATVFLEFRRKMEVDFWEICAGHLEDIVGVGEENVAAIGVKCHELVFAFLKGFEGFGIVAFNPAGFVE